MCASCCMNWAFRCSAHDEFWPKPTLSCRIAGTARSIPILKKSPNPRLGPDLQRRSQLPPRLHLIRDLEPSRPATADPRDRTAEERQDLGSHRTVSDPLPLPPGDGLQRLHLPSLPQATGRPLSATGRHSHPRQCLLSQRPRRLVLVRSQSTLAGSPPTAALLPGVQPYRTTLAIHAKNRNPQSVLLPPLRIAGHPHSCLY